jgi:hypothetical protein
MAVDEQEALEAMPQQGMHDIAHHRDQRGRPQRDGTGEGQMMLRHADGERRRHQAADLVAHALRDELGIEVIGADQPVRPVLFRRADRDDDAARPPQIILDLLPGGQGKLHGVISYLPSETPPNGWPPRKCSLNPSTFLRTGT